jgi:hypothetical protein
MKFGRSEGLSIRIKGIQNSTTIKTLEIRPTRPDNLADSQSPALKWAVCIFVPKSVRKDFKYMKLVRPKMKVLHCQIRKYLTSQEIHAEFVSFFIIQLYVNLCQLFIRCRL